MSVQTLLRTLLRLTSTTALVLSVAAAHAVDYRFPGAFPTGCGGTNGSYTCGNLTLGYNDTITVLDPRPATITIKGALTTDTSTINAAGAASDLTLIVSGAVTLGYKALINANITAGSLIDRKGQISIGGSITTTTGDITLDYQSTVAGSIATDSGAITVGHSNSCGRQRDQQDRHHRHRLRRQGSKARSRAAAVSSLTRTRWWPAASPAAPPVSLWATAPK